MTRISALVWLLLLASCSTAPPPAPSRPNIIVVLTDDQGFGDVGAHGNERIRTPHIDRFAREGVELSRFYVEPVCAPTRAALLTGRYYYRSGVVHTSRGGAKMHADETTIAEMLSDSGYRSGIFGKWHLGDNYPMRPIDQGFERALWHKSGGIGQAPDRPSDYFDPLLWSGDEKLEAKGYCTDVFFDAALDWIAEADERPFFVYLPTNAPHTPLTVAEQYWKPYAEAGLDETTARVYGMVENIDENFGRLLSLLDERGLRENTLIALISDNGPQHERYNAGLRGRKTMNYEGGIRALSYWQWPAALPSRRTIDTPAAHVDLAPTLLAAARLAQAPPLPFDGRSLMPLLAGHDDQWPERKLFFQCHRGLTPKLHQNAAVVTDRFKLVLGPGSFDDEAWTHQGAPPFELYDLQVDPGESRDLAASHPQVAQELRESYQAWFADVASTREFAPGVIHVGSDRENPATLCRYQDSSYVDGRPTGWKVHVEQPGEYRVAINRGEQGGPATLHLAINGQLQTRPLAEGETAARFELPAGPAVLDIWIEPGPRPTDNSTLGDVVIERL